MSLAVVKSRALRGLEAPEVLVEVHMANGLPQFTLVGLADTEVKEARERVRAALLNSGFEFPHNKRITCNLAPADLPKDSGRFDLPIALGILAASGQLNPQALEGLVFAGELSLAGDLRPVRGALAMTLACGCAARLLRPRETGATLVLPMQSAQESALVRNAVVYGARHLRDVVNALQQDVALSTESDQWRRMIPNIQPRAYRGPDLSEVKGHAAAKRVLEIAAAGGHSVLMVGPPGSGKSMLAHRFAGLLPEMTPQEALESAAVLSLGAQFEQARYGERIVRAPHHSASAIALVGGGNIPRPGEISLAHHGVLFLDELAEFPRTALEALREPLETGQIAVSRAGHRAEFPARFQLIAAMNPCPCGYLGAANRMCRCTSDQITRYQGKLSGPLLDRIDLQLQIRGLSSEELLLSTEPAEKSSDIRSRVEAAQQVSITRQGCLNGALHADALEKVCEMGASARQFLQAAANRLSWSSRATHRAMKVARTIADMSNSQTLDTSHLAEAMQYRRVLTVN